MGHSLHPITHCITMLQPAVSHKVKTEQKVSHVPGYTSVRARPFLGLYANTNTVAREGVRWLQSCILSEDPGLIPSTTIYSSSSRSLTSSVLLGTRHMWCRVMCAGKTSLNIKNKDQKYLKQMCHCASGHTAYNMYNYVHCAQYSVIC